MGFGQTVEQKFAKKNNGFDGNSISNLIEEREKKNGFWTNGGIEFAKKKRWVLNERWNRICQKIIGLIVTMYQI